MAFLRNSVAKVFRTFPNCYRGVRLIEVIFNRKHLLEQSKVSVFERCLSYGMSVMRGFTVLISSLRLFCCWFHDPSFCYLVISLRIFWHWFYNMPLNCLRQGITLLNQQNLVAFCEKLAKNLVFSLFWAYFGGKRFIFQKPINVICLYLLQANLMQKIRRK